jgi:hypothetical protein
VGFCRGGWVGEEGEGRDVEMRGAAFSGEEETKDEGMRCGFWAGELIGFLGSWAWAVVIGLEARWVGSGSISRAWAVLVSGLEAKCVVSGSSGELRGSGAMDRAAGTPLIAGRVIMGCHPSGDPSIEGLSEGGIGEF